MTGKVEEHFKCSEQVAERALSWAWNVAVRNFWEEVEGIAKHYLGEHVKVWQEGRSGGWLVVEGLGPVEDWNALAVSRWARLVRWCEREIKWLSDWEQVRGEIEANRWAEEGAEEYNFVEGRSGKVTCLADVPRCAHCAGTVAGR